MNEMTSKEIVVAINKKVEDIKNDTDEQLQEKFKAIEHSVNTNGLSLEDILIDVYAIVKVVINRLLHIDLYDEQLLGGIELHRGKIIQMATGEGKTFTAVAPAVLNAITHKGVHIMTTNDYLSERDYNITKAIYSFLGIRVGLLCKTWKRSEGRKEAYSCDITFGQNSDFVFDYLFDNLSLYEEDCVQRNFNFVIVDEADSVFIDDAQNPHVIEGGKTTTEQEEKTLYEEYLPIVQSLIDNKQNLYEADAVRHKAHFTKEGADWLEERLHLQEYQKGDVVFNIIMNTLYQLLLALTVYRKDIDYVVIDDEIVIVDENTGRIRPMYVYEHGLHEAIEAKEHVKVHINGCISAIIAIKNFISKYRKLSGMTGTAIQAKTELSEVYGVDVAIIPTHNVSIRKDYELRVFKDKEREGKAILAEVKRLHEQGRPILLGTQNVIDSEWLAEIMDSGSIEYQLLNAKTKSYEETKIIDDAGKIGQITVATSVAGRGTDIKPSSESLSLGGLAVIGLGLSSSQRIDSQLKGRTGRQGNVGTSQFFVSLDDEIVTFLSSEQKETIKSLETNDEGEIVSEEAKSLFYLAQKYAEDYYRELRNNGIKRDDIIEVYRKKIYETRAKLLFHKGNTTEHIFDMLQISPNDVFAGEYVEKKKILLKTVMPYILRFASSYHSTPNLYIPLSDGGKVVSVKCNYQEVLESKGESLWSEIERQIAIKCIDIYWQRFINEINNAYVESKEFDTIYKKVNDDMHSGLRNFFEKVTMPIYDKHEKGETARHKHSQIFNRKTKQQ